MRPIYWTGWRMGWISEPFDTTDYQIEQFIKEMESDDTLYQLIGY